VRDTGSSGDVSDRWAAGDVSVNGHRHYLTARKAIWNVTAPEDVTSHIKVDRKEARTEAETDSYRDLRKGESFDDS
jgi:hypothetical protein